MTIAVASLGSWADTTARSSLTCEISRAPGSNTLVLVGVLVSDTAGTPTQPTGVTGAGLTFSIATSSVTFNPTTPGSEVMNVSLWRGMGGIPDGSMVTATFANSNTGGCIIVDEVSGVSTGGTAGSSAVSASATSRVNSNETLTIFLPSAASTANAWYSIQAHGTSANPAIANNWVLSSVTGYLLPSGAIGSAYTLLSTATASRWTTGATEHRAGISIELVADNPPPSATTPSTAPRLGRRLRIPQVPSEATGALADWARLAARQLNQEGFISLFSGADPNTSGFTGIPGNLLVNIGSASTASRLFIQQGSVASISTTSWRVVRIA